MNESPAGRDGWILTYGRRIYHVYKQAFPMEFWYGLDPEANRETSDPRRMIDVRTLPEKYRKQPVEVRWTEVPKRSFAKRHREQLTAHAMAFARAIHDGYDLAAHAVAEHDRTVADWAEYRAKKKERERAVAAGEIEDDDVPF